MYPINVPKEKLILLKGKNIAGMTLYARAVIPAIWHASASASVAR
jgi:hypothetical protein